MIDKRSQEMIPNVWKIEKEKDLKDRKFRGRTHLTTGIIFR